MIYIYEWAQNLKTKDHQTNNNTTLESMRSRERITTLPISRSDVSPGGTTISPVSKKSMQLNDCLFFLQTELSSLDIWPEVVSPPESTALPASLKPCIYVDQKTKGRDNNENIV